MITSRLAPSQFDANFFEDSFVATQQSLTCDETDTQPDACGESRARWPFGSAFALLVNLVSSCFLQARLTSGLSEKLYGLWQHAVSIWKEQFAVAKLIN